MSDEAPTTQRSVDVARAMAKHGARRRFDRPGLLALLASAWGQEFELPRAAGVAAERPQDFDVVMIMGPLTHHGDMFGCDSYDAIEERVKAAIDSSASTIVLKIDSPGGDVDGCFESSRTIRAMAKAAGKRLIAYADELAASAGYALACAADEIYLPASGRVGSVGVINCVFDETARAAKEGVSVAVITSGRRKSDGCPFVALSAEAKAGFQAQVDSAAELFAKLVAESRGRSTDQILGLEAGMFCGEGAVQAGLADGVKSWSELLAMLASGEGQKTGEVPGGTKEVAMAIGAKEIVAALEHESAKDPKKQMTLAEVVALIKAISGEDTGEESAPDSEGGPPSVGPESESAAVPEPVAAVPVVEPAEEPKKVEVPAAKVPPANDPLMQLAAELQGIKAERQAEKDAAERAKLLASRPDFDASVLKALAGKPTEYVRFAVETFPRSVAPAAAAQVSGTRGKGQESGSGMRPNAALDALMGLSQPQARVHMDGGDMVFPVLTPEQARAALVAAAKGGVR